MLLVQRARPLLAHVQQDSASTLLIIQVQLKLLLLMLLDVNHICAGLTVCQVRIVVLQECLVRSQDGSPSL